MPTPPESPRAPSAGARLLAAGVAALVCVFYLWTASSNTVPFGLTGDRADYYNRLSHGFLAGHTFMDVAPLPADAPLEQSVEAPDGHRMPFLLDASFYQGKYYLYFGPAPVLAAFLPYRLLTGSDVSDNLVAAVLACGGFLVSFGLLWRLRNRFFPHSSAWLLPLFAVLLGLGNVCAVMLRHPMFYEAAIACAFCFLSLFLLGLHEALTARGLGRRLVWLAGAGAAGGLAVAARANYAPATGAVALPLLWFWWTAWGRAAGRSLRRCALAAFAPLAACAAGLMAYNYCRFGSVLEFGVSHQFTYRPVFNLRFLPHNLKLYYFSLPELSWYFPFVLPIHETSRPPDYVGFEHLHGQVWSTIWLLPVLAGLVLLWSRRGAALRPLAVLYASALGIYLVNLAVLLCLGGRANRYMVDFQPTLMLLAAVSVLAWNRAVPRRPRRFAGAALAGAVGLVACHNLGASWQLYDLFKEGNPSSYTRIARVLNAPTAWAGSWLYPRQGPISLQVRFPSGHPGETEPLLVTGSDQFSDFVFVRYLEHGLASFGMAHFGYPEAVGPAVPIEPGRAYQLTIDAGSLYPPAAHPFFAPFSRGETLLIRRNAVVSLDDRVVFKAKRDFNDASPGRVYVGKNPFAPVYTKPEFSGTVADVARGGLAPLLARRAAATHGPIVMDVMFPRRMTDHSPEPLLVTGERERGDAMYVVYVDERHVRFGCDHWGWNGSLSEPVELDPLQPHRLEIWMGSLFPPAKDPRFAGVPAYLVNQLKGLARLKLDGREVFRAAGVFHDAAPATVDFGSNAIGLSSCRTGFSGEIQDYYRMPVPFIEKSAASGPAAGPLRMRVAFPAGRIGRSEPLLATGRTGQGDMIYVTYLDGGNVRFSLDHWGAAVISSPPVPIRSDREYVLELSLASLEREDGAAPLSAFALARAGRRRGEIRVRLDGRDVFTAAAEFYPVAPGEVAIGTNSIGSSVCDAAFGGAIESVEWLGRLGQPAKIEDYGPLSLGLVLPKDRLGQAEPLVVTGRTGAADALIVAYVDAGHIRLAWDHWGKGGPSSALIPIDYDRSHALEVTMGSFYPADSTALARALSADETARRRTELQVKLDGAVVFAAQGEFHAAASSEFQVGSNTIGLSSAQLVFTGAIEKFQRSGEVTSSK